MRTPTVYVFLKYCQNISKQVSRLGSSGECRFPGLVRAAQSRFRPSCQGAEVCVPPMLLLSLSLTWSQPDCFCFPFFKRAKGRAGGRGGWSRSCNELALFSCGCRLDTTSLQLHCGLPVGDSGQTPEPQWEGRLPARLCSCFFPVQVQEVTLPSREIFLP